MDLPAELFLNDATALQDQIIAWRRDLHQHPELAFHTLSHAGIVAAELQRLGLEVATGVGRTGVVGILSGETDGPTVLVRCDMDALPIEEANAVGYRSRTPGTMHACGHDGHTAIGLAVARLLHARRNQIAGCVKFIFQPAEEVAGGANAYHRRWVAGHPRHRRRPGYPLVEHFFPGSGWPVPGPAMAGAAIFEVTIGGRGGQALPPTKPAIRSWRLPRS